MSWASLAGVKKYLPCNSWHPSSAKNDQEHALRTLSGPNSVAALRLRTSACRHSLTWVEPMGQPILSSGPTSPRIAPSWTLLPSNLRRTQFVTSKNFQLSKVFL